MFKPRGVISSMVTSFDAEGRVDEAGVRRNISFQADVGVKTICMLGGTGEPFSMTPEERCRVMRVSGEAAAGKLDLVIGALVGDPAQVAADIAAAAEAGASACMITTPPFVRPSERDVRRFFAETAARSKVPLILFNVPSRSGFLMSAHLIADVAREIDAIVAVKESSRDVVLFSDVREHCPPEFSVLQGVDSLYLPTLALNAEGGILAAAAAFPELCLEIERGIASGDLRRARERHYQMMPLVRLLYEASHPGPLKHAIERRGLPVGGTRPPLYGITDDHRARLEATVDQLLEELELRLAG